MKYHISNTHTHTHTILGYKDCIKSLFLISFLHLLYSMIIQYFFLFCVKSCSIFHSLFSHHPFSVLSLLYFPQISVYFSLPHVPNLAEPLPFSHLPSSVLELSIAFYSLNKTLTWYNNVGCATSGAAQVVGLLSDTN